MQTRQIIEKLVRFVTRYYLVVIGVAAILTAICAPRGIKFLGSIDTDLTRLLPDNYKSVETIKEIRKKFKTTKTLLLVVEDADPDKARAAVDDLAAYVGTDPEVDEVESKKRGYDFFDKHKLLFLDLDDLQTIKDRIDRRIQREKLSGLYIDFENEGKDEEFKFGDIEEKYKVKYSVGAKNEYYTNDDQTIYSIYVYPKKEPEAIKQSREFYTRIKDDVDRFVAAGNHPTTKIYFTGSIRTQVDEYNQLIKDLTRAGLISGIGMFIILLLYFRRISAVVLLFMPLTMGIMVSFAYSSLFIKNLNLVTSFLFAILGGLGVEIGIHMLSRYIEERRGTKDSGGKSTEDALFDILYHTGGSALTSMATVAATFLILLINDFKGFSEFGFIAGFGLIINYLCYMLVFPSILVLAEKIHFLGFKRKIGFVSDRTQPAGGRFPLPKFIMAGLAIFAVITIIDLPRLSFEWRFSKIKAEIPEALEAKAKQRETSKSVNRPAVVIIHNKEEADAIKNAINKEIEKNPDTTVVDAFKSYYDLVPDDQVEKLGVVGEMKNLLADKTIKLVKGEHKKDLDRFKEALNETVAIREDEVPAKVKELFAGQEGNPNEQIAYINPLPHLELDDGRNAIEFAQEIEKIQTPAGTFYPSSDAIVFADVLRTMIADGKRAVVLAFLLVFFIVYLDFRKFSVAVMIVSPIALGVLYMFGLMYIFGIKMNFYNMVVAPTIVGTSIDNSVHLYHRYKELGKGSLMTAFRSSGGAALMSSLTNIFGFLGLAFAFHNGLRSIGDLAVAGMAACLITTLVYFPALLQLLEDRLPLKTKSILTTKTQRHQEYKKSFYAFLCVFVPLWLIF